MSDTKALIIGENDWKDAYNDIDNRLFNSGLMKLVSIGGKDSLIPKNKGVEYLLELLHKAVQKPSSMVSYRQLMEEVWGRDKYLTKECSMRNSIKALTDSPVPILFSVIYTDLLKEYGEFAYFDTDSSYPTKENLASEIKEYKDTKERSCK